MKLWAIFGGGLLFGFGLALSGMTKPEVVLSFLQLTDLGLLFVMGGAVLVAMLAFKLGPIVLRKPVLTGSFGVARKALRKQTIIGAVIFGVGWGLSGLCPGSALAGIGIGNYPVLIGIAGMFAGAYVQGRFLS